MPSNIVRLEPPIPLLTPKGKAQANFLIDYGFEQDLVWVCFQDDTGECWSWNNRDIRAQRNVTANRTVISSLNTK